MDNLMMLHFTSFHPKYIKEAIPYRQALCVHRICSDKEECDRHLKMVKDALIRMGYNAQLIDHHPMCHSKKLQRPPQKTDTERD
eukprot:g22211.t1